MARKPVSPEIVDSVGFQTEQAVRSRRPLLEDSTTKGSVADTSGYGCELT